MSLLLIQVIASTGRDSSSNNWQGFLLTGCMNLGHLEDMVVSLDLVLRDPPPKLVCSKVLIYIFKALVESFLYFLVVKILCAWEYSFACVFRWIDLHEIILLQPPFLFELTKQLS
jgi:hypothetical protein